MSSRTHRIRSFWMHLFRFGDARQLLNPFFSQTTARNRWNTPTTFSIGNCFCVCHLVSRITFGSRQLFCPPKQFCAEYRNDCVRWMKDRVANSLDVIERINILLIFRQVYLRTNPVSEQIRGYGCALPAAIAHDCTRNNNACRLVCVSREDARAITCE